MTDEIDRLRLAAATVLRVLKIMEPEIPTAHDRFKTHPSDIAALHFIGDHPGGRSRALADFLGVAATTATSIVDRLVNAGLVARERPAGDRRSVALSLTGEGEAARAAVISEERETNRRFLEALPAARRAAFVRSMELIAGKLNAD
ncbi:MAG: MarR family transcriptional regulator [Pseudomonadota bacterium]